MQDLKSAQDSATRARDAAPAPNVARATRVLGRACDRCRLVVELLERVVYSIGLGEVEQLVCAVCVAELEAAAGPTLEDVWHLDRPGLFWTACRPRELVSATGERTAIAA